MWCFKTSPGFSVTPPCSLSHFTDLYILTSWSNLVLHEEWTFKILERCFSWFVSQFQSTLRLCSLRHRGFWRIFFLLYLPAQHPTGGYSRPAAPQRWRSRWLPAPDAAAPSCLPPLPTGTEPATGLCCPQSFPTWPYFWQIPPCSHTALVLKEEIKRHSVYLFNPQQLSCLFWFHSWNNTIKIRTKL